MNSTFAAGDRVKHAKFGIGEVLLDRGATVVVTFEHGLEQCPPALLQRLDSFATALARPDLDPPAEVWRPKLWSQSLPNCRGIDLAA